MESQESVREELRELRESTHHRILEEILKAKTKNKGPSETDMYLLAGERFIKIYYIDGETLGLGDADYCMTYSTPESEESDAITEKMREIAFLFFKQLGRKDIIELNGLEDYANIK